MSKKNDSLILLLALTITTAIAGGGMWWVNRSFPNLLGRAPSGNTTLPQNLPDRPLSSQELQSQTSSGDRLLFPSLITPLKQQAAQAYAGGNYRQAVGDLENSLKANRNDPEALVYLNNGIALRDNQPSLTLVASLPIGPEENAAKELLRGIAQAQNEINQRGGIRGKKLRILIADDRNDDLLVEQLAKYYSDQPEVLGVIGHFGSDASIAGSVVYESQGLAMISPTSTSTNLSGAGKFIFRTVPSDRFAGSALEKYTLIQLKKRRAAIFYNSTSNYSKSLKDVYTTDLFTDGGEVVAEFDLEVSDFNAANAFGEATQKGAEVLVLLPNSAVLDQALQILQVNGGRLPSVGGDSMYKPKTLEVAQRDGVNMVIAVPWHIDGNPGASFPKTSRQLWGGEVNWRSAMAYDAAMAFITALGKSPQPTRTTVQAALSDHNFSAPGAGEPIRFLASGDRNQRIQLVQIRPGKISGYGYDFVPVKF